MRSMRARGDAWAVLLVSSLFAEGARAAEETTQVVIDGARRFQTIDGFGTCLISWDPAMADWYERPEAARVYAAELRFNILRSNLWGDGTIGPVEDWRKISSKDPEFARRDPRTPVFIAFARAIRALNPEVKVIGTVWSPPAWMKVNGKITDEGAGTLSGGGYTGEVGGRRRELDNRVRPDMYPHFAKWLVEMVRHYEAHGVPMYAISPANEPGFTQTFESCVWSPDDLARITGMIGELLTREGLSRVKLFGPEHMTGFNWEGGPNRRFVAAMRSHATAWRHFDVWATHGYADGVAGDVSANSSAQFWELVKLTGKPVWATEGGTGGHEWPEVVREKGVGPAIHNALVAGNVSAFVPWQFAEGSRSEHNVMPLDGPSKKTHVVRHFSRYIPSGSVRIGASPAYGDVLASAYALPRGGLTVVLIHPGDGALRVRLRLSGLTGIASLNAVGTDAGSDSKTLSPVTVARDAASVTLGGPSIVTLTTLEP